jgi:hypothetical protein
MTGRQRVLNEVPPRQGRKKKRKGKNPQKKSGLNKRPGQFEEVLCRKDSVWFVKCIVDTS